MVMEGWCHEHQRYYKQLESRIEVGNMTKVDHFRRRPHDERLCVCSRVATSLYDFVELNVARNNEIETGCSDIWDRVRPILGV